MNMYEEMQKAVVKAGRFNIQAFEITILTDNKLLRLRGNPQKMKEVKQTLWLDENHQQVSFVDILNEAIEKSRRQR
uniref:Uncharacterized protein n=1 Tax=virus sp. ctd0M1 TaxID=2827993 RepID=A0A8S5REG6_9VIRU|nr:MAG TPA: hypothetical protein [virus sp. ctd0M1]